ncbi:ribonuclease III domain protein [Mogibacterium sp. CM50]|jgi:Uncharacterized protein conserved in bacteria|nr:ribonuclease III domain protein [Mogibacterium sp. CM50]
MHNDIKSMNTTTLAYMGDAVYELQIRELLIGRNKGDVGKVHKRAIAYVSSDGQSKALKTMMKDFLTEEERKLVKRARNKRATSRPRNADPRRYKLATGFEALIGALYLVGDKDRLEKVIHEAVRIIEED